MVGLSYYRPLVCRLKGVFTSGLGLFYRQLKNNPPWNFVTKRKRKKNFNLLSFLLNTLSVNRTFGLKLGGRGSSRTLGKVSRRVRNTVEGS